MNTAHAGQQTSSKSIGCEADKIHVGKKYFEIDNRNAPNHKEVILHEKFEQ
ncbi:MAG: hypothetical protein ACJAVI_001702 [Candidatus Azotimanducaceae bacterium]|jgi:hypothetical protein